jgi:hypothetical protein
MLQTSPTQASTGPALVLLAEGELCKYNNWTTFRNIINSPQTKF